MTQTLEESTAQALQTAQTELKEAGALAELATLAALEAQARAAQAKVRVQRTERALAILRGEEPFAISVEKSSVSPSNSPVPATSGPSVAEIAAARAAAGDPLANRKVDNSDPRAGRGPAPANRPKSGPQCPGCGSYGTLEQVSMMVGEKGPFPGIACSDCGHSRLSI